MKLNYKILQAIAVILVIIVITFIAVYTINKKQEAFLIQYNLKQFKVAAKSAISSRSSILEQSVDNYTFWENIIYNIKSKDKQKANQQIQEMLQNINVDAAWLYDSAFNSVLFVRADQEKHFPYLKFGKAFLDGLQKERVVHSYKAFLSDIIEIIAVKIPSDNKSENRGYLIVAKSWDSAYLQTLGELINCQIEINNRTKLQFDKRRTLLFKTYLTDDRGNTVAEVIFYKGIESLGELKRYSSTLSIIAILIIFSFVAVIHYILLRRIKKPINLIKSVLKTEYDLVDDKIDGSDNISRLFLKLIRQKHELAEAKKKLEELDNLKAAFLANISHELRTPMNGILGFTELLKKSELPKEKIIHYATIISSSSHQLLSVLNNIIDISKIQAGQVVLDEQPVNLNHLIIDIYMQSLAGLDHKDISFEYTLQLNDDKAFVMADKNRLKQILNGLLSNAFKFTERGEICFGYEIKNDFVQFYVKDTGIGISQEDQGQVFQIFQQLENSISKRFGGMGLGLSISKALVEKMGGKIWLISKPGKGSTFYFTIPYELVKSVAIKEDSLLKTQDHPRRN